MFKCKQCGRSVIKSSQSPKVVYGRNENRLDFINSQKINRYSSSNHSPFLVHIESLDGNIGNVHPMKLGKILADYFPAIQNIRRLGRNIIVVSFKFSFDANSFVQSNELLPENWVPYIPNYKIIRSGIVRGVDPSLSYDEISQGIKWKDRPIVIRSIERLKYRDSRNNNELRDSSTVKIDFVSNLLPEFISIWSVRLKVRPYVNKVRKCFNCLRWGHSSVFCRGISVCSGCGDRHENEVCSSNTFLCPDCKQIHPPFDNNCPIYLKYCLVNKVMAFCNINQYLAKRQIKVNKISSLDQIEKTFKSCAYLAWDNVDIISNLGFSENSSTPSVVKSKNKNKNKILSKRKTGSNRPFGLSTSENDQIPSEENGNVTLVPTLDITSKNIITQEYRSMSDRPHTNNDFLVEMDMEPRGDSNIDKLFPSPGVIIRDIYDLYKSKESKKERDFAVLNYLSLLFRKNDL